jgi:hypothetical protein
MGRNISAAAALLRGLAAGLIAVGTLPVPISALAAPAVPADVELFSAEQLDALLAPIALYPDPLLAQVLMASAYPVQIVQAQRWLDDPRTSRCPAMRSNRACGRKIGTQASSR